MAAQKSGALNHPAINQLVTSSAGNILRIAMLVGDLGIPATDILRKAKETQDHSALSAMQAMVR